MQGYVVGGPRGYYAVQQCDGLAVVQEGDPYRGSVLSVAFARAKVRAGWGRDGVEPVVGALEVLVVAAFEGSFR